MDPTGCALGGCHTSGYPDWESYQVKTTNNIARLADLLNRSPQEIGETTRGWLDVKERDNCFRVWKELTHRQQEVLQAFASGLSRQEVAQKLGIAVTTVDSHRKSILSRCEVMWEAQSGGDFDTQFLQKYFGPFLAGILE